MNPLDQAEPTPVSATNPAPAARRDPAAGGSGHFRRGVFSVGGGSLVGVAALFVEGVIVARALPIDDMGVYAFYQAALSLLIIAVDLGFRTTAAQYLAAETEPRRRAAIVSSLAVLRLAVLAVVALPILASVKLVPGWLGMPALGSLLAWLPLVLALASYDELFSGILQGFQRYRALAMAQVVRSLLRLGISAVLLLVLHRGLDSLVLSWIVSFAVSSVLQWIALPIRPTAQVDGKFIRGALSFGMPLQLTRYLWFGMQRVDTFVLSAITGPVGVAFYDVAGRLPQGLQRLTEAYYAVYHPDLSSKFARNDSAGAARLMTQSMRLFGAGTLFVAWGAVLFGREAISLLFKPRYAAAAPVFVVMLLAFGLATSLNLMGYALTAHGRPSKSFAMNLLRSTVSLGGDFILVPLLGFGGAAYATLISQAVAAPLAWYYLRQDRLPAYGGLLLRQFALAGALLAALWWLPPLGFVVRILLLAAFPVAAAVLALVTPSDLSLLFPERWLRRVRLAGPVTSHPGGSEV